MRKLEKISMVKVKTNTNELIKKLKRELSVIEKADISSNDVIERALSSEEIQNRLKLGARERRSIGI